MAIQTPRQRLQRPSYGSPNTNTLSASTAVNRKASLNALTGANPKTPKMNADSDLDVGDAVNVPGDMFGTVRFIGTVRGKNGRFVGVELDREFAAKGKNDGDVDGVSYFNTSIPGAGIFLPVHRAEKRTPPPTGGISLDSFPATPDTPSYSTNTNGHMRAPNNAATPPTPAMTAPHKFAQSVGPGVRPSSPNFKPKRPSLPRPESPFRKQPPNLAPTPARTLSQSQRGGRPPGVTPNKNPNFAKSTTSMRPPPPTTTPRPYSRSSSRLGRHGEVDEGVGVATTSNGRTTSSGSVPSFSQPLRSPSRLGSAGGPDHQELQRLKSQLAERDRRLEEQAASLAEMEQSVKELSAIIPAQEEPKSSRRRDMSPDDGEQSIGSLRQMLREKNEKISLLTAEFDAHRADFRSTLDSLEMASTETERVYEEQKRDLLAQVAQLHEAQRSQEASREEFSKEDFEGVAAQLKQLEDLVAELEEGLEESRRGEAEARGEVEFLRGEVERGRSELRRERERSAAQVGAPNSREVEAKDDEIRGLKAIIHNLGSNSSESSGPSADEVEKLRSELEETRLGKESLEKELEGLRRDTAVTNGHSRNESERTAKAPEKGRSRAGTVKATATFAEHASRKGLQNGDDMNGHKDDRNVETDTGVYCDVCSSDLHDTVECTSFRPTPSKAAAPAASKPEPVKEPDSPGKENETTNGSGDGKGDVVGVGEEDKWCALCEQDGHLAFDCPEEY